jgi:hypothetical protein
MHVKVRFASCNAYFRQYQFPNTATVKRFVPRRT